MSWSFSMNPTMVRGAASTSTSMTAADFLRLRERTAGNSKSAVLLSKYRLKCAVTVQVLMVMTMAFRLSVALYVMVGIRPPRSLQKLRLPAAKNWEIVWLLGNVVTCLIGVTALLRNRPTLVRFYSAGSVLCGVVPTLYAAAFDVFDDLLHFYHTHHSKLMFQGIPVVILWSIFLAAAIQLHIYTLYFAWSLLRAWKQRAAELRVHKAA